MTTKERPILFSGPMVRAILDGRKTQTRRIVKPRKDLSFGCLLSPRELAGEINNGDYTNSPYGQPDDRLWVKETTYNVEDMGWEGPVYVESDEGRSAQEWGWGESDDPDHIEPHDLKKRPSLFMTRARSRITLEITGVRVEKLKDISRADAAAEGVEFNESIPFNGPWFATPGSSQGYESAIDAYRELWEFINGSGSWNANPWVWVVEFRRTA